jgi:hypothetical protein
VEGLVPLLLVDMALTLARSGRAGCGRSR